MTFQEFFNKYNGVGVDYDNFYGFQCMDLANQYNQDVVGAPRLTGNAVDVWTTFPADFYSRTANNPDNFPQKGDLLIWGQGVGQFGHIAICIDATPNTFSSFDQNWPLGSVCHTQPHNYTNLLGWLTPKAKTAGSSAATPAIAQVNDQTKIDMGEGFGIQEVQAIRSILHDQQIKINSLSSQGNNLQAELNADAHTIADLQKKLVDAQNSAKNVTNPPVPPTAPIAPNQSFTGWIRKLLGI